MKIKGLISIVLLSMCIFIFIQPVYAAENKPVVEIYKYRQPWSSPFNPHEVLRKWICIDEAYVTTPNGVSVYLVTMVNPKINWEKLLKDNVDFDTVKLPKGECALSVSFIFTPDGKELAGYIVIDNIGDPKVYSWKGITDGYVLVSSKKKISI